MIYASPLDGGEFPARNPYRANTLNSGNEPIWAYYEQRNHQALFQHCNPVYFGEYLANKTNNGLVEGLLWAIEDSDAVKTNAYKWYLEVQHNVNADTVNAIVDIGCQRFVLRQQLTTLLNAEKVDWLQYNSLKQQLLELKEDACDILARYWGHLLCT